jgi:hypothetical protein
MLRYRGKLKEQLVRRVAPRSARRRATAEPTRAHGGSAQVLGGRPYRQSRRLRQVGEVSRRGANGLAVVIDPGVLNGAQSAGYCRRLGTCPEQIRR